MGEKLIILFILNITFIYCFKLDDSHHNDHNNSTKMPLPFIEKRRSAKYDNPNHVRDRLRDKLYRPHMPDTWKNRYKQPFHPAWMDYCDPYHCNDYHKPACGLNRKSLKFKWFQSGCHIILNNMCANYRGFLKYDMVEAKFCASYAMPLRTNCPISCDGPSQLLCGINTEKEPMMFRNKCAFDATNCKLDEESKYVLVHMNVCETYLRDGILNLD